MIKIAMMAVLAAGSVDGAEARAMAKVEGRLKIDGQPAQVKPGACARDTTVLASVVFVAMESGEAVARVDLTCAEPSLRFSSQLPKGWYQAVVWPGVDATNLVNRPYAFNTPVFVGEGKNVLAFDETTLPFKGVVQGGCDKPAAIELIDTEEPFSQTVAAVCVDHQLRFETRLPRGTYEVHLEQQGRTRTLSDGLVVRKAMDNVVLGQVQLTRR